MLRLNKITIYFCWMQLFSFLSLSFTLFVSCSSIRIFSVYQVYQQWRERGENRSFFFLIFVHSNFVVRIKRRNKLFWLPSNGTPDAFSTIRQDTFFFQCIFRILRVDRWSHQNHMCSCKSIKCKRIARIIKCVRICADEKKGQTRKTKATTATATMSSLLGLSIVVLSSIWKRVCALKNVCIESIPSR